MNLIKSKKEILESVLVFGFLLGILLPIRLVFVRYVTDNWLGSLGILVYGMETAKADIYQIEIGKIQGLLPQQTITNPEEMQKYVETELPKLSFL